MKNFKQGMKWGVRTLMPKTFNLLVIFGLVFQPVGPAGLASVAWAIDEAPVAEAPAVSDTKEEPKAAPAVEEPKKEEAAAPKEEPVAPAPKEVPVTPAVEEPVAPVVETPTETPAVTPAEEPAVLPAEPAVEPIAPVDDTEDGAATSQETVVEEVVETPVPVEETAADENLSGQTCLSDGEDIKASSADEWTVDGDKAETKEKVALGVAYEFPLDKDVKVTFTCLPKDESSRAALKIERIKTADINLPEGMEAASEYAYDITTDGMDNGDFKYDLVLPKSDMDGAEVKYIEQSADEVVASEVTESELKAVDEKDVDEKSDAVEVTDLDHFTIFIFVAPDQSLNTNNNGVSNEGNGWASDNHYVEFNDSDDYAEYGFPDLGVPDGAVIDGIEVSIEGYRSSCQGSPRYLTAALWNRSNSNPDTYTAPVSAALGTSDGVHVLGGATNKWGKTWISSDFSDADFRVKVQATSGCSGSKAYLDQVKVKVYYTVQHTQVTFCHATPPDTAAQGYNKLTIDDDGVLGSGNGNSGHAGQHSADIIPPFDYYGGHFNGQNWDIEGRAIWNNDCKVELKGGLKVIKTVDDHSDLTKWSFKLDNGNPIKANVQGQVDFGQVVVGTHTITEVGPNVYTATVAGLDCKQISSLSAEATVSHGKTTICTFSNAVNKGTITVIKDALPAGQQAFSFDGSLGKFTLVDDGVVSSVANTKVSEALFPGSYMIEEKALDGWKLTDISCLSGNQKVGQENGSKVTLDVHPGENIICTFTNTKQSHITIVKDAQPNDAQDFSFYTNFDMDGGHYGSQYSFNLDDDNDRMLPNSRTFELSAGKTYTVQEGTVNGWKLSGLVCDGGQWSVDKEAGRKVMVALGVGEDITCTFTNVKPGEVTVTKVNDANGNGRVDRGERTMGGWTMHLDEMSQMTGWSGSTTFENVMPDEYSLSETAKNGWVQTNIICSRQDDEDHGSCHKDGHDGGDSWGGDWKGWFSNDGWHDRDDECDDDRDNHGDEGRDGDDQMKKTDSIEGTDGSKSIEVGAGEKWSCQVLNTRSTGEIVVNKVIDRDGNLETTNDQSPAAGWEFTVAGTIDDMHVSRKGTTAGEAGSVAFDALKTGSYNVTETVQSGYDLIAANCGVENGSQDGNTVYGVHVGQDAQIACTFYNVPKGSIHGTKWNDCDGNGRQDDGDDELNKAIFSEGEGDGENMCRETGKGGVRVYLDLNHNGEWDGNEPSDVTDEDGYYEFTGLVAGNYSVQEVVPEGWQQTSNVCAGYVRNNDERLKMVDSDESDGVNVSSGSQMDCPIGNMETPRLSIEKENDASGSLQPGATVRYRIKVTAHDNDVKGVQVTDLPPKGFTYVGGSAVASQGPGLTHTYASPGIWDLGDMTADQTVTLEYDTVIAADQDPGDYKDLAYAIGSSEVGENDVLADDLMDADNFVGTRVAIVVPEDPATVTVPEDKEHKIKEKTVKKTKYVLGASTTLPMTGGGMGSVALAIVLFLSGLGAVVLSRRKQLSLSIGGKTIIGAFAGLVCLMGAGTADAASLAVQMEKPEAIVQSADFKIGFVALDILNRPVTVECQVKKPAEASFSTFSTPVSGDEGGNSGDCQVSLSVMSAGDGIYQFRVAATADDGEGSDEDAASTTESVELHSSIPGTPYDYDRNDGSCMNNITFRTAADSGKTVKVELYRSASTTFTADAATKVTEQAIGSDVNGSFSVAAPGCSDDFFYALRAVDVYGNASAFVGDKDRDVDTDTVKNTKTTIVETAGPAVGAIPVSTGTGSGDGQVEGASTTNEDEGAAAKAKEGSVLGDSMVVEEMGSWMGEHPWQTAFGLLIIIALIAYAYRQWKNRKA